MVVRQQLVASNQINVTTNRMSAVLMGKYFGLA
jgi:hypothetical protein